MNKPDNLTYIEQLLMILKDLQYNDLTVQDLKDMHDEMLLIGLLPEESSEAHFTKAMLEATGKYDFGMSTAKYDQGYGNKSDMWADKGDIFEVNYLVYNDKGEKLQIKSQKPGKIKVSEALKVADQIKKDYDAYKVVVVEKNSNQMLARIVTKGPAKEKDLEVNLTASVSTANPQKYNHIDFKPPQSVADEAELALKWRAEYHRGGTDVGVQRAKQLKNRQSVSPDTIRRMVSYFARHGSNEGKNYQDNKEPTAHWVAWKLWGGDAGRSWCNKLVRQMESADKKATSAATPVQIAMDKFIDQRKIVATKFLKDKGIANIDTNDWERDDYKLTSELWMPLPSRPDGDMYNGYVTVDFECSEGKEIQISSVFWESKDGGNRRRLY